MKFNTRLICFAALTLALSALAFPQAENVPVNHPVYTFLKRMEVRGILRGYSDVIIPISRKTAAKFLMEIRNKQTELTQVEGDLMREFLAEFRYDISKSMEGSVSLIDSDGPSFGSSVGEFFGEKEKYLYAYSDSNLSLFVDGLLTVDARRITGDSLGNAHSEFVQLGGRIRGTIWDRLGYYIQGTNAQFYGSRALLEHDRTIGQAYTLGVTNAKNFDFAEGYVRYDADFLSLELGRERVLWGAGYGDRLILSDNPRVFDFIRADAHYKALSYTLLHGWILGTRSELPVTLPFDTSYHFDEPVVSDKYFAAHRLALSFPSLFTVGFQEIVIYSNRSPDLAYFNPMTLFESAQRSRDERDNMFWAFDIQTHFLKNVELQGSIDFDDINIPLWGTDSWENRYAWQAGVMITDPLSISNTSLAVEYTRVEPYTFSHGRSRDNNYTSLGRMLGVPMGPNAEGWFFKLDHYLTHRLFASFRYELQHNGQNIYDSSGRIIRNVGGNVFEPHRTTDSNQKEFLGGDYLRTQRFRGLITYEILREIYLDGWYQYQRTTNVGLNTDTHNHDFGVDLRVDF